MISLRNLSKRYQRHDETVPVFEGLNLDIAAGEFVSIMGASGVGKTTLLNIIGCLDTPTAGHYLFDGEDVVGRTDRELAGIRNRKIGFVFQSPHFVDYVNLVDNVALPGYYSGAAQQKKRRRAQELLTQLGLDHRLHHRPGELSGGEAQRASLARALFNHPCMIVADEPTGNLDRRNAKQIVTLLAQLSEEGITVVMVTHDEWLSRTASRRLYFQKGRIDALA